MLFACAEVLFDLCRADGARHARAICKQQSGCAVDLVLAPEVDIAGERRQVKFNAPTTYCQADLQVGFADGGQPAVWRNLNLCTLSRIKLVYDRMTGMTTASYDD